jgi:hypothetical protein
LRDRIPGRNKNQEQIRERWYNNLELKVNRNGWQSDEE